MTQVTFSTDNDQYLKDLWRRIDFAQDRVWIVTYNLGNDLVSSITMKKLIEAQKRGVNVCVMVDHMNSWAKDGHRSALRAVGGQYMELNHMGSLSKIFTGEFFSRHHEKLYLVDEHFSTGSQNINQEYGGLKYGISLFKDLNINVDNSPACSAQVASYFHSLANRYGYRMNYQEKQKEQPTQNDHDMHVQIKFRQENQQLTDQVLNMINTSQKEIILLQPYYYTVKKFEKALSEAMDRGVKVKVFTTQKRDQPCYKNVKNEFIFKDLMAQGMEVYEYRHQVLHMKGYLSDGKHLSIGSMNQDRWSWYINNELNIFFSHPMFYQKLSHYLTTSLQPNCYRVYPDHSLSWMKSLQFKFWDQFMRWSERFAKQSL